MNDLAIAGRAAQVLSAASDNRTVAARAALEEGRTDEAAQRFESLLATMLVREMRKGLSEGFFSGAGADTYSAWLDEHLGAALAETDALGLAGLVKAGLGGAATETDEGSRT